MRAFGASLRAALLTLLLAGCGPLTQLLVVVEASPEVARQLTYVRVFLYPVEVTDAAQWTEDLQFAVTSEGAGRGRFSLPLSFGLAKGRESRFRLVVQGFASSDPAAPPVIEQKAITSFVDDRKLTVRLALLDACYGRASACSALDRTCVAAPREGATVGSCGPTPEVGEDGALLPPPAADGSEHAAPVGTDGPVATTDTSASCGAEHPEGCGPLARCALDTGVPACVRCDDAHCPNVDNCPAGACAHGRCVDGADDYSCACDAGYVLDAASKTCRDIDDCAPGLCEHGTCVDGVNSYACMCDPGYPGTGTRSCTGADDCPAGACANGTCVDGDARYSCRCNPGFAVSADGHGCAAVNDCPAGACANGTCRDGVGSWDCACDAGFTGTGTRACTAMLVTVDVQVAGAGRGSVSVTSGTAGASCSGARCALPVGGDVTVTAQPAAGFAVERWSCSGASGAQPSITLTNVRASLRCEVSLVPAVYTVTLRRAGVAYDVAAWLPGESDPQLQTSRTTSAGVTCTREGGTLASCRVPHGGSLGIRVRGSLGYFLDGISGCPGASHTPIDFFGRLGNGLQEIVIGNVTRDLGCVASYIDIIEVSQVADGSTQHPCGAVSLGWSDGSGASHCYNGRCFVRAGTQLTWLASTPTCVHLWYCQNLAGPGSRVEGSGPAFSATISAKHADMVCSFRYPEGGIWTPL